MTAVPYLNDRWLGANERAEGTWAISCFYVRKGHRQQGITKGLLEAAVAFARSQGATVLEAMPLDGNLSPIATGAGYVSTFKRAGFAAEAYRDQAHPLMRLRI